MNDRDPQANTFTVSSFKYDSNGDGITDAAGVTGIPVSIGGLTTTGAAALNAGTFVLNTNGAYTFTPTADFHGFIDIDYTICDNGSPVACVTAVLHIDVLPDVNGAGNDRPFAGDDFVHTTMNIPVDANFVNNDQDPNNNSISMNGVTINTGGAHTLIQSLSTLKSGNISFYADGTYTYTPPVGYMGPDQVSYSICDVTAVAPQPLCANAIIYFLISNGTLLPVDLLSLTGKKAGKDNFLQWITSQENNSSHFAVENRTDNSAFATIGSVTAKGTSNTPTGYNYVHHNPIAVVNYYRLKLVDLDGHFKYSNTIAIKPDGAGVVLNSIYPNPFTDKFYLAITCDRSEKVNIVIYDVQGRIIQSTGEALQKGFNSITVNGLKHIASGTYYIEVKGSEDIIRAKLLKSR